MKPAKAYSYLRFSTPEQSKGDSFRRQTELSRAYAKQHKLDLDETLTFKDLGVSAFRGMNAQEGALGVFLKAVETGKIRKGSYLLVENLDRLSRDTVYNAFLQFTGILTLGVNVVTLSDERTYTAAGLNTNFSDLLISLSIMQRAHDESAMKSKRLSAAWKAKRDRAQVDETKLTALCPAWLTLNKERNGFLVDGKRKKVVQRIFKMTIDGHGKSVIARRFNAEGIPPFGKSEGWHGSYIQKILESEAVCGVFQPMKTEVKDGKKGRVPDGEPIAGYFPVVVDRVTFERARASRQARRIAAGRKGLHFSNLFTGLMFCGACGATMHYVNKGEGSKGGSYLACSNARRAVSNCKAPSWRYPPVEALLVLCLEELNYDELFPEIANTTREALQQLEDAKLEKDAELAQAKRQLETIVNLLIRRPDQASLMERLDKAQAEFDELSAATRKLDAEIASERERAQNAVHDFRQVKDGLQRLDKAHQIREAELYDLRSRLHQLLRRTVQDIKLHHHTGTKFAPQYSGDIFGAIAIRFQSAKTARALYIEKGMGSGRSYPVVNGKEVIKRGTVFRTPSGSSATG